MNPHVLAEVIMTTESLAAFLHGANMGLLVRMNTADVALQVFAAIETLATAIYGASKRPGTLPDPSGGNRGNLGGDSSSSTLLCQIRDWHGGCIPTRPGHSDIAAARNLNIEIDMRRRAHRRDAGCVTRKRLGRYNRRERKLDCSRSVGKRALGRGRLGIVIYA